MLLLEAGYSVVIPTGVAAAAVIGFVGWLANSKIKIWDKHVEDCNEIPKTMILEKIADLKTGIARIEKTQQIMIDHMLTGKEVKCDNPD